MRDVTGKGERPCAQVHGSNRLALWSKQINDISDASDVFKLQVSRVIRVDLRLRDSVDSQHDTGAGETVSLQLCSEAAAGQRGAGGEALWKRAHSKEGSGLCRAKIRARQKPRKLLLLEVASCLLSRHMVVGRENVANCGDVDPLKGLFWKHT